MKILVSHHNLLLVCVALVYCPHCTLQNKVTPFTYRLTTPTNYSGSSFTSDCTFSPNTQGLKGCGRNTRLINDITDIGTVFNPNNFIGWDSSISNVTLQFDFGSASVDIRQVDIYFYHNPTEGYGLPDIEYFSSFDNNEYFPLFSTVGDNYELSQTDNEVQMVSLLIPPFGANYQTYRLVFNFTSYQINQTFISEVVSFTAISSAIANDPIQFLSPNQTIQLGPSTLHPSIQLSCTVTNNGSFIWNWTGPGVDNRKTQVLLADTSRTSILLISRLSANDSGNYTCTAHYEHSAIDLPPGTTPINTAHRTSTIVALTLRGSVSVVSPVVAMRDDNITINCTFTGYLPTNYQVLWRDTNGDDIENNSTVTITNTPLGQSQRGGTNIQDAILTTLSISSIEEDDYGSYTCLIIGTNLTGTVMVQEPPSPPPSSSSAAVIVPSSSSSIISSSTTATIIPTNNPTLPLTAIGGMVAGAVILLAIILVLIAIVIIYVIRKRKPVPSSQTLSNGKEMNRLESTVIYEDLDGLVNDKITKFQPTPPIPIAHNPVRSKCQQETNQEVSNLQGLKQISASRISLQETVGQGEFGIVYRALWTTTTTDEQPMPVAVKTLRGLYSEHDIVLIKEECHKMSQFDDPHVLTLIGVCLNLREAPCIIMPYMARGSLLSYLKRDRPNLTVNAVTDEDIVLNVRKQLMSMCLQVSQGMAYLAGHKFVHRDLAARNCMIDNNGIIKVADFGLSEDIYSQNYFRQCDISPPAGTSPTRAAVKLPVKWMALESIHEGLFSEKTDVWSFGVLCWEVFSVGQSPYPGLDPSSIIQLLEGGGRLLRPVNEACSQEIYDKIMMCCWDVAPSERPTFNKLVNKISDIIKPLANYTDIVISVNVL